MKITNTKPIAILLGVYNGSKYLSDQLDSLIGQTNKDWSLYIRDDSSTDDSYEIISRYCVLYPNFFLLEDDKGNLRCRDNFFELLAAVDSDYYMFCDQDDIWLPNKIDLTFDKMKQNEIRNEEKAIVVFTDLAVVDENLNEISSSFWNYTKINPWIINNFEYLSVCNLMTGCTMMLNKKVCFTMLPISSKAVMHDCWIALKTVASGGIIDFVGEPTILYRQHENNVIGANEINRNYLGQKLRSFGLVLKQNKLNLEMIRSIKRTYLIVFLYYKVLYYFKR